MPATTPIQPIPFINFNGNCAEAMHFYADALGGKIRLMLKTCDSPIADQMPEGFGDKILNAQIELPGGGLMFGGDCPPYMEYNGIRGMGLALTLDTVEEAEVLFNRLAEGGEIEMPFAPTFWAKKFGMVTDKYGVNWLINGVLLYS